MVKPRLKVYRAQMGFAEAVVAAPNQKAALEAWGARQNLFAEGLATVTDDPAAVAAATAKPGVVLQRPVGGRSDFAEQMVGRPEPPPSKPKAAASKPPQAVRAKPKPDRSALTAAEKALAAVEKHAASRLADLASRRERLDAEEARVRGELDGQRSAARRKLDEARRTFDAA